MDEIIIYSGIALVVFGAAAFLLSGKKSNTFKGVKNPRKIFKMRWGDGQTSIIIDVKNLNRDKKIAITHRKNMSSPVKTIIVPEIAISGFNKKMIFKYKKYMACCHMYDSDGNKMDTYGDEIGEYIKQLKERDEEIGRLQDELKSIKAELDVVKQKSEERLDDLIEKFERISSGGKKRFRYPEETGEYLGPGKGGDKVG